MTDAMPAGNMISSIFGGVELAVGQVGGFVNNHTDRLADNPCAWTEQLDRKFETLSRERLAIYTLANEITVAGAAAVNSCWASAGFSTTARKFNTTSVDHFGQWLKQRGYPTGIAATPYPPHLPAPYFFVRHAPPSSSSSAGTAVPGYAQRVRLIGAGGNLTLGGPEIWEQWIQWRNYARLAVEPKGVKRSYKGAKGWRAILGVATGHSAPAWNPTMPVTDTSLIANVNEIRDLVSALIVISQEQCNARLDAMLPSDSDSEGTGAGAGTIAIGLALLAKAAGLF